MRLMATDMIIGIDVGTTAVKAGLLDASGTVVADFRAPCTTLHPGPGLVEQDPDAWVAGVAQALAQFGATSHAPRVAAIGLCSQVNTHVFVDARDPVARHPRQCRSHRT